MGINTIPVRGQTTITPEWFNLLRAVLINDVVPRNVSGIPENNGGNLGTADYRWNDIHATRLILDGSIIDPGIFAVSSGYRIASGKAKTSGYPDFLTPAGSGNGLSATVDATGTDLVTTINETQVTLDSDLIYTGLSGAPASNNTATIADTRLDNSHSTKFFGEYTDEGMTLTSIGTEISDLDGEIAAFLIGTEVILALVDNALSAIFPIYRGWAGTDRATINNGATVTLLKLSTILLKNDGVTKVASTFYPESVLTSPAAGTGGKVYFERDTRRIGYDTGDDIDYNYLVLGYAVCDDTDCLWVQPYDFDLSWSETSYVSTRVKDDETVTVRRGSGTSICGESIELYNDLNINTTDDMDSGETIAANRIFFIYAKKDGDFVFSTVAPRRYSTVVKGFYHPLEYYRCVGAVYTDASSDFLAVTKDPMASVTSKRKRVAFTSSGSWICPPDVTEIVVFGRGGAGGGAGGAGGNVNYTGNIYPYGGGGGAGCITTSVPVSVVPGTTYTVTVGSGGAGGNGGNGGGATGSAGQDGSTGQASLFGSLAYFRGGQNGIGPSGGQSANTDSGGDSIWNFNSGGAGRAANSANFPSNLSLYNNAGLANGDAGSQVGSYNGGGGGGYGGPGDFGGVPGDGGDGGNGRNTVGTAPAGSNGTSGTHGCGGGGGGGGGNVITGGTGGKGGNGGAGSNGQIIVEYFTEWE